MPPPYTATASRACHAGLVLRMLRARRDGRSTIRARLVAAVLVLGLIGLTAPIVAAPTVAALRWLLHLL
jgi:hypothetical protein